MRQWREEGEIERLCPLLLGNSEREGESAVRERVCEAGGRRCVCVCVCVLVCVCVR